jgi:hypothetical protein
MLFSLFFTFYRSRPRFEEARGPRYRVLGEGDSSSGSVVVVALHSLCGCSNRVGALALQRDLLRRSENPPIFCSNILISSLSSPVQQWRLTKDPKIKIGVFSDHSSSSSSSSIFL